MTGLTGYCVGVRRVQAVQYQLRGISIDISLQSFGSQDLFLHIINIKPFYHHGSRLVPWTENVPRATTSTPGSSLGCMCHYPLQYRVESHAGWPSLGFKAEAKVNYGTFNVYVFFLLCHFIISQILAWSQWFRERVSALG